ncbi:hypothetical protein BGZ83_004365 [Gryganskiella cystojenkinii]|nr:hypothetical protein BGZ83_004365 [Gryganskiella cystojenkinii]
MPSRIDTQTSVIKIVSVPKTDSKNGLPGVTLVMDNETGEPRGLVNARLLTALRTAAGSALATRAVFAAKRQNNNNNNTADYTNSIGGGSPSLTLVIFGSGAQAKAHIQLLVHVLPQEIKTVVICNRTLPRAQELVQELTAHYPGIDLWAFSMSTGETTSRPTMDTPNLQQIVSSADILCTCTNSREPLFNGDWVQQGTHVNMVGSFRPDMHEVDQTLIQRAFTLVDARHECEEEAGELILAIKESGYDGILAELGHIFDSEGKFNVEKMPPQFGSLPSPVVDRTSKSVSGSTFRNVSIFKSVGIAAQDVAITSLVLEKAEAMQLGSVVDI